MHMVLVAYKNELVEFHCWNGNVISSMNLLFSKTNITVEIYFKKTTI